MIKGAFQALLVISLLLILMSCAKPAPVSAPPIPTAPVKEVPATPVTSPEPAVAAPEAETVSKPPATATKLPAAPATYTVEITSSGFSPKTVTIKAGEEVTFTNTDSASHWVASNVHPTHTTYPGSDIRKCETEPKNIFDACHGLQQGEEFSFTFSKKGRWPYHNHLHPSMSGTVVVE